MSESPDRSVNCQVSPWLEAGQFLDHSGFRIAVLEVNVDNVLLGITSPGDVPHYFEQRLYLDRGEPFSDEPVDVYTLGAVRRRSAGAALAGADAGGFATAR